MRKPKSVIRPAALGLLGLLALLVILINADSLRMPLNSSGPYQAAALAAAAAPGAANAGHHDPYALTFEVFAILLLVAMLGRFAAIRLNQSPVLGELLIGIVLGAILYQAGSPLVTTLRHFEEIDQAAQKAFAKNLDWPQALRKPSRKPISLRPRRQS